MLNTGKALLRSFNENLKNSKVLIQAIMRAFKKYLVKKNKLPQAGDV
jgi:hypothetical protein